MYKCPQNTLCIKSRLCQTLLQRAISATEVSEAVTVKCACSHVILRLAFVRNERAKCTSDWEPAIRKM
jgi:hypothetical protein